MEIAPTIRGVRDGVVLVEYPGASDEEANREAVALAGTLRGRGAPGILDAIPAARTLLVLFDPDRVAPDRMVAAIREAGTAALEAAPEARLFRIPVAYGGAFGPDLGELARERGLSEEEFARRHAAAEHRVAFLGFAPGFPYLTGLPAALRAPRLPSPRPRVAEGTVAIAAGYTGIYPGSTPGGWRLIGRTSVPLFDPDSEPPALLSAGDAVRFEAVRAEDLPAAPARAAAGPRGRPVLRALTPGVFASVQGGPRFGLGSSGVPAGGAMDTATLARANDLVGNAAGEAGLEIALVGPELEALDAVAVAIAGADLGAEWNGRPAPVGEAFRMSRGDRLRLGRARLGARAYLAVAGGLEAPHATRRVEAGGVLTLAPRARGPADHERASAPTDVSGELRLRVAPGLQLERFASGAFERFLASAWRVSAASDRRGLRLEGPVLGQAEPPEIPPEGVVFGSIQVPGEGLPIVLGPDGPVTGGYPKIATVLGPDLPLLGQAAPGAILRFAAFPSAEPPAPRGSTMGLP